MANLSRVCLFGGVGVVVVCSVVLLLNTSTHVRRHRSTAMRGILAGQPAPFVSQGVSNAYNLPAKQREAVPRFGGTSESLWSSPAPSASLDLKASPAAGHGITEQQPAGFEGAPPALPPQAQVQEPETPSPSPTAPVRLVPSQAPEPKEPAAASPEPCEGGQDAGKLSCARGLRALFWTMDGLPQADHSDVGGEKLVRRSLTEALERMGWTVQVVREEQADSRRVAECGRALPARVTRGQQEQEAVPAHCPHAVLLDPFTARDRSRQGLRQGVLEYARKGRVFVLDFFGVLDGASNPAFQEVVRDTGASRVLTTFREPRGGKGRDAGFTPVGFALPPADWAIGSGYGPGPTAEAEPLKFGVEAACGRHVQPLGDPEADRAWQGVCDKLRGAECGSYAVVWGKRWSYLKRQAGALRGLAEWGRGQGTTEEEEEGGGRGRGALCLVSTMAPGEGWKGGGTSPLVEAGMLPVGAWRRLLRGSDFLLGMGDPVAGPTAIEALAAGTTFVNPVFRGWAWRGPLGREQGPGASEVEVDRIGGMHRMIVPGGGSGSPRDDLSGFGSQHPEAAAIGAAWGMHGGGVGNGDVDGDGEASASGGVAGSSAGLLPVGASPVCNVRLGLGGGDGSQLSREGVLHEGDLRWCAEYARDRRRQERQSSEGAGVQGLWWYTERAMQERARDIVDLMGA